MTARYEFTAAGPNGLRAASNVEDPYEILVSMEGPLSDPDCKDITVPGELGGGIRKIVSRERRCVCAGRAGAGTCPTAVLVDGLAVTECAARREFLWYFEEGPE